MSAAIEVPQVGAAAASAQRWMALVFISLAQLVIALDATIMNIALPSVQRALAMSDADRQWVITAYTLAFGGLVLLGGRLADLLGRRRIYLIGLLGFGVASAAGGMALNLGMLIGARALQGAFAALLAPSALSLLAVTFTSSRERAQAFAVYGAIAGSGAALGLLLGGLLVQELGWRWCLYVNVPIVLFAAAGGRVVLPGPGRGQSQRLDLLGALLASAGLVALVSACSRAAASGWGAPFVIVLLLAAVALLGAFVLREWRATHPLLPLRILADRNRGGAYLVVGLAVAGMLGLYLFLTYYLQLGLGYSPVMAGLAFLPLSAAVMLSSQLFGAWLLPRVPHRFLIVPGLLLGATAMALLSRLSPGAGYAALVLPVELLLGLGLGCVFAPAMSLATQRVAPREAGVASAVVNTAQQVGGSLGTAFLNTIAANATAAYLAAHTFRPNLADEALVSGLAAAALWGAAILAAAAVLAAVLINTSRPSQSAPQGEPA